VAGTAWVAVVSKCVVADGVTTLVEETAWVAVVWKLVGVEGVTTRLVVLCWDCWKERERA
jgi:hypothetical protein